MPADTISAEGLARALPPAPPGVVLDTIGDSFAADVTGLDLSRPVGEATLAWIEAAFARHPVLVFRDQALDAAALDGFARRFGRPQPHVLEKYRHPDIPEVSYVTNVERDGSIDPFGVERATMWHADATYEDRLPRLAMLHALTVPDEGGGTLFADMRAAYAALPEAERRRLAGLTGLHRFNAGPAGGLALYATRLRADQTFDDKRHPAVLPHPATGAPLLFVNPAHTHGFVGMPEGEGRALIEHLAAHAVEDRFVYHHRWQAGDLLMWDERATMHRGAGDSPRDQKRVLLRSIVYPADG